MLLEAQLAALRWAVKAKAEAFMDSVRQAIAGAPDGRDGSRHRQTAEMPWPELVKSERRVSLRAQFLAFLINTHVPWLCSTHSGFPRAHRDHPSAQATRPVAGAIGLPR